MTHPLVLPHAVRDPLYGMIGVTKDELRVLDHQLFRRLHGIRQNGLLYLVFPAATHTRFEHSLGVLSTVDQILQSLLANSVVAANKVPPAVRQGADGADGEAIDIGSLPQDTLAMLFTVGRLAALVHDLGHGPFSHYFEPFAPRKATLEAMLSSHGAHHEMAVLFRPPGGDGLLLGTAKQDEEEIASHEVIGCLLMAQICNDLSLGQGNQYPLSVAAVILGRPELAPDPVLRPFVPLLHDIIASAPADADRMDYVERDSRSVGVSYGLYDRPRLLKSLLVYSSVLSTGAIYYRLGIKHSGLRAAENFVQARFELFVQVYYHKTNRAVQIMLEAIAARVQAMALSPFDWNTWETFCSTFGQLSDGTFFRILRGLSGTWSVSDVVVNDLANRLHERRLWKRVYEGDDTNAMLLALHDRHPTATLVEDSVDPKATKDLDTGARLLYRTTGGCYKVNANKTWLRASPLIEAMRAKSQRLNRIYLTEGDGTLYGNVRESVWSLTSASEGVE